METTETNSSFFPPPPTRYLQFTKRNLSLAQSIGSKLKPSDLFDRELQKRLIEESLSEQEKQEEEIDGIEEIDLRTLIEPPNLDYVRERGGWSCFGDWEAWPGKSFRAMLEGMPKLYEEKMERKDALQALLNTLIYSYLSLLNQLGTKGPPSLSNLNHPASSTTDQIVSHIELTAFNMHGLCNELRPRQARETLKMMMREQAKEKREKARMVLKSCEDLRNQLVGLKKESGGSCIEDQVGQRRIRSDGDGMGRRLKGELDERFLEVKEKQKEKEEDWNALLRFAGNGL